MGYSFILGADDVNQEPVGCKEITTWHKTLQEYIFADWRLFMFCKKYFW